MEQGLRSELMKNRIVFAAGAAMGLLVGFGMLAGALIAIQVWGPQVDSPQIEFPESILHASATHGGNTMAMATGPIDAGVEGLFVLDFITGELQCSVLNPRTLQLGGLYKHNVVTDLGVEIGKQPRYLLVTGAANVRSQGGNIRPAQSIVYVADTNTGNYAAYMLPWNRTAQQYNFTQTNPMILLGRGTARNVIVE
jgi:hypothetical protein